MTCTARHFVILTQRDILLDPHTSFTEKLIPHQSFRFVVSVRDIQGMAKAKDIYLEYSVREVKNLWHSLKVAAASDIRDVFSCVKI